VTTQTVDTIFNTFSKTNVLIIGDVMVDAYLWGNVERISPEAPVPVVAVTNKESRLGGAANVALNIKALGATPIICSVYGKDSAGKNLVDLFNQHQLTTEGLLCTHEKPTTIKTRVISHGQQMLRIDEEIADDCSTNTETQLIGLVNEILATHQIDVIIFEDYNKGLLTTGLINAVIELAIQQGIPTAVDPKKKNFLNYKNVDLFKPNLKELREGLKIDIDKASPEQINQAVNQLNNIINNRISFITLSEYGVFLKSDEFCGIIPAHKREIADVSGAGDTVISVAALCLAQQMEHDRLAQLSNLAGGMVCEEVGVVPINKEKFYNEVAQLFVNSQPG